MDAIFDVLAQWGSEMLRTEVTKMTVSFMIAAYLHRRWVRKDIAEQIGLITQAIDNLGRNMKEGFQTQSKRIDDLTIRVDNLEQDKS